MRRKIIFLGPNPSPAGKRLGADAAILRDLDPDKRGDRFSGMRRLKDGAR